MSTHFDCIGLPVSSQAAMARLVDEIAPSAEATWRPGGRTLTWTDPSGARLTLHLDADDAIECVTPSFAATPRVRARLGPTLADGECPHCDRLHVEVLEGDDMVYPMALQLEDMPAARDELAPGAVETLAVVAFAEQLRTFASEAEYHATPAEEPRFAAESLIPCGLFGEHPTAHVLLTGRVLAAEERVNAHTGRGFVHAVVRTFGTELEVVAPLDLSPRAPAPGSILQGTFWVVGRSPGT